MIASRGADTLRERFLGSTLSAVIRMTDIPTLIERIQLIEEVDRISCEVVCEKKFSRILFATDFSGSALEAENAVVEMAGFAERIVLMSVVDEGSTPEEIEAVEMRTEKELEDLRSRLGQENSAEVAVRSATGIASRHIAQVAEEEDATIIVMGTRGKGRVEGVSLGSTAEATTRIARRPVLLIPSVPNGDDAGD